MAKFKGRRSSSQIEDRRGWPTQPFRDYAQSDYTFNYGDAYRHGGVLEYVNPQEAYNSRILREAFKRGLSDKSRFDSVVRDDYTFDPYNPWGSDELFYNIPHGELNDEEGFWPMLDTVNQSMGKRSRHLPSHDPLTDWIGKLLMEMRTTRPQPDAPLSDPDSPLIDEGPLMDMYPDRFYDPEYGPDMSKWQSRGKKPVSGRRRMAQDDPIQSIIKMLSERRPIGAPKPVTPQPGRTGREYTTQDNLMMMLKALKGGK